MKVTYIDHKDGTRETNIEITRWDKFEEGLRHYFGCCHGWCAWCITEAEEYLKEHQDERHKPKTL